MSSDHIRLLRRPLPPKRFPPDVKTPPAPRPPAPTHPPAGVAVPSLLLDQGDAGTRGSGRKEADTPAPRAAPPTPLLPHTSPPLTDRIPEGFPCKPPQPRPQNPLLHLLQPDSRFLAPPPSFCLSDFLQNQTTAPSLHRSDPNQSPD